MRDAEATNDTSAFDEGLLAAYEAADDLEDELMSEWRGESEPRGR